MDFLKLVDKRIIVFGLANRKSVACAIAKVLQEAGAEVIHVVRSDVRKKMIKKTGLNPKRTFRLKKKSKHLLTERFMALFTQLPLQIIQTALNLFTRQTRKISSRLLIFPVSRSLQSASTSRNFLMRTVRL